MMPWWKIFANGIVLGLMSQCDQRTKHDGDTGPAVSCHTDDHDYID